MRLVDILPATELDPCLSRSYLKKMILVDIMTTKKLLSHDMTKPTKYWADAQADLSLRWVHTHFVCFVMSWLTYYLHG